MGAGLGHGTPLECSPAHRRIDARHRRPLVAHGPYFFPAFSGKKTVSATQREARRASQTAPSLLPARSVSALTPRSDSALASRDVRLSSHFAWLSNADTKVHSVTGRAVSAA